AHANGRVARAADPEKGDHQLRPVARRRSFRAGARPRRRGATRSRD
ncbi:MAG: hypothetical protein AVDCRST_MAG67-4303, partial [uncultured Solirubrobacteraceae bacterium]